MKDLVALFNEGHGEWRDDEDERSPTLPQVDNSSGLRPRYQKRVCRNRTCRAEFWPNAFNQRYCTPYCREQAKR